MRIRDDDVGQVAEGLETVGEADGDEGEGEVGGGEEGELGEWWTAMSRKNVNEGAWVSAGQYYFTRSSKLRSCSFSLANRAIVSASTSFVAVVLCLCLWSLAVEAFVVVLIHLLPTLTPAKGL